MKNHRLLSHDGGQLLIFLIKRLSIPRDRWCHTYCFDGQKKSLPTIKVSKIDRKTGVILLEGRREFLFPHMEKMVEFFEANRPCVVVTMGKLACECLTGYSILSKRAGTCWEPNLQFSRAGLKKVWITHSPDAALYNPELCVTISRIIGRAALEANIDIAINYDLPMFDFSNYTK